MRAPIFGTLPAVGWAHRAWSVLCAAALQMSWAAWGFGQLRNAAYWGALSVCVWGWLFSRNVPVRKRRRWLVGYYAVALSIFAAILSILNLLGGGGVSGPQPVRAAAAPMEGERAPKGMPEESAAKDVGGSFRSVILLTDVPPQPMVAPPIPATQPTLAGLKPSEPLTIPFFGAYWFFRLPARRPGASAFVRHGRADEFLFRSADMEPLEMEARQNLGRHYDLRCCSRVEVAVSNADAYPGSLSLELVVGDSSMKGRPQYSLGRAAVTSTPRWSPGGRGPARPETLRFDVPPRPILARFDELIVVFHRARMRRASSAKVAIEKFVLVPR